MKKLNRTIWIIIFTLFSLFACKNSPEQGEKKLLANYIEQMKLPENYKWIIILPGVGCHGCIEDGEYFMQQNIKNKDILFILTKISSLKILQQKIGFKVDKYTNIYVDKKNIINIPINNSIYPCVIKLEKGRLSSYSFQNPSNDAFRQLKQQN
ncbi:MAG: hypothetical protein PHG06_07040 [Parabacteroides sp.]|nr:hypothetical protein [Parabacteroides sp.]